MTRDSRTFGTRLLPSPWFQVALVIAGGAVYTLALVRRGLSPSDIDTLEGARNLVSHLPGGAPAQTLAADHPFAEWLLAFAHGLTGTPMATLWVLGTAAAAATALPAVWQLLSGLKRPTARWSGFVVCAASPIVVGVSSASFPAALTLAVWSWILVGLTAVRRGGFERLLEWVGWGMMIFLWPPALVWLGLWLLLDLTTAPPPVRRIEGDGSQTASGIAPRPRVALGDLFTPVASAGLMTLILPGFQGGAKAGWETFLQHILGHREGPFWFAGYLYAEARPPLWAGLELFVWSWPAAVVVAGLIGWAMVTWRSPVRDEDSRILERRRRRCARLVTWGLPFTWLIPWLTRHASWGSIEVSMIAAPIVALAASTAIDGLLYAIDNLEDGPVQLSWLPLLAALAVALSTVVASVRSHPLEGSYYNGALGGLPAAVERGHRPSRDHVLPVAAILDLPADKQVFALDDHGRLERYAQFNWIPVAQLADGPDTADLTVRALKSFGPGDAADGQANRAGPDLVVEVTSGLRTFGVDGFPVWFIEPASR